jgi:hypothetical protein
MDIGKAQVRAGPLREQPETRRAVIAAARFAQTARADKSIVAAEFR